MDAQPGGFVPGKENEPMDIQETLRHLRHEHAGRHEAQQHEREQHGTSITLTDSFYDFVVSQGVSRQTLSAHGISRADLDGEMAED